MWTKRSLQYIRIFKGWEKQIWLALRSLKDRVNPGARIVLYCIVLQFPQSEVSSASRAQGFSTLSYP